MPSLLLLSIFKLSNPFNMIRLLFWNDYVFLQIYCFTNYKKRRTKWPLHPVTKSACVAHLLKWCIFKSSNISGCRKCVTLTFEYNKKWSLKFKHDKTIKKNASTIEFYEFSKFMQ